jgi:hypothetical protein
VGPWFWRQSAVETSEVINSEGQSHPILYPHPCRGQTMAKSTQLPRNPASDLQDLGHGSLDLPSWRSLSRRIFIPGESKCFMDSGWCVWAWLSIWGFQLLNRGTICQFWFQFYKHYLFRRLNLCEHECTNETWHFHLLNAPSPGKGSKRVHKTSHGIWGIR